MFSFCTNFQLLLIGKALRRGIQTEQKAKVVAAVLGTTLIQFFAALTILHQDDLKKGINSSYSSCRPGAIHPILQIILVQNS